MNQNHATKKIENATAAAEVVPNKHRDMLAVITIVDGAEIVQWMHKGTHVFTVTTFPDGSMKYRSAIDA